MITLRIFFIGLIAFAYNNTNQETMTVYLPESANPNKHYPFLLYESGKWGVTGSGCSEQMAKDLGTNLDVKLDFLHHACRELGNIYVTGLSLEKLTAEIDDCNVLPSLLSADTCRNFCWVPRMDKISDGTAVQIDPAKMFAGTLVIQNGDLSTFEFATDKVFGLDFIPAMGRMAMGASSYESGWETAVAEAVVWDVEANPADLKIKLVVGASTTELSLKNGVNEEVDIVIGNMPNDVTPSNIAEHFMKYYDIAKAVPGKPKKNLLPAQKLSFGIFASFCRGNAGPLPGLLLPFHKRFGRAELRQDRLLFERSICPQALFVQE